MTFLRWLFRSEPWPPTFFSADGLASPFIGQPGARACLCCGEAFCDDPYCAEYTAETLKDPNQPEEPGEPDEQ
jgi:hypothetical protein